MEVSEQARPDYAALCHHHAKSPVDKACQRFIEARKSIELLARNRFLPRKNYDIFNNLQLSMIVGAAECRTRASRNGLFAGSSLGLAISSISINVSSPAPCKRAFCSLADKKAFIKLSEYCCVLTRLHTLLVPPPEKKTHPRGEGTERKRS
jgi:hypothetical protein